MNKKILYCALAVLACTQWQTLQADYPYQEPDLFNQKYQKSNYHLAGDLFFYSGSIVAPYKHLVTVSPLINPKGDHFAEFKFNTPYSIFSMFYRKGQDEECDPYRLPKPVSNNTRIIFDNQDPRNPSDIQANVLYPNIIVTRTDDVITIYVANPKLKEGSKLTFNIANFEKYMKTTAWYNSREQLGGKFKKDSAITFGFAINADDFNFTIPKTNATQVINSFSLNFIDIIGAMRFATCDGPYQYITSITPFTNTMKIKEKNIKNSYEDLYKTHTVEWKGKRYVIPPALTIESMNATDLKTFDELLKKGNTN